MNAPSGTLATASEEAREAMRERAVRVLADVEVEVRAAIRRRRTMRGSLIAVAVVVVLGAGLAETRHALAPEPYADRLEDAIAARDHVTLAELALDRAALAAEDRAVPGAVVRRAMRDCDTAAARILERGGAHRVVTRTMSAPVDVQLSTAIRYCGPVDVARAWASSPLSPSPIDVMIDAAVFGRPATVSMLAALGLPLETAAPRRASALEAAIGAERWDNVALLITLGADTRYRSVEGIPLDWLIPRWAVQGQWGRRVARRALSGVQ